MSNEALRQAILAVKYEALRLGLPRAHVDKFDTAIFAVSLVERYQERERQRNASSNT